RLKRDVDAEVLPTDVRRPHARVARAGRAAVVEVDRDRPAGPGRNLRLELVGGGWVGVVVDDDRVRPRVAAVGRLRELDVELSAVPVLPDHVEVAGIGGAGREVLEDPVTEGRVRQTAPGHHARRGDGHEPRPGDAIIGGPRDVDGLLVVGRRLVRGDGDVDVPGGIHGGGDVLDHGPGVAGRRQGYPLREALAPVARGGD